MQKQAYVTNTEVLLTSTFDLKLKCNSNFTYNLQQTKLIKHFYLMYVHFTANYISDLQYTFYTCDSSSSLSTLISICFPALSTIFCPFLLLCINGVPGPDL